MVVVETCISSARWRECGYKRLLVHLSGRGRGRRGVVSVFEKFLITNDHFWLSNRRSGGTGIKVYWTHWAGVGVWGKGGGGCSANGSI